MESDLRRWIRLVEAAVDSDQIEKIARRWQGQFGDRVAACLLTDRHTIPAYVGSLRNPNQIWGPREKVTLDSS